MKRTKAVAALLLCHPIRITPFAPKPGIKRTRFHGHGERWHLHSETDKVSAEADASSSHRRTLLNAAALLPLALTSSCAAADEPLSQLLLGKGSWIDNCDSSDSPVESTFVPPSFATYLARFLIRYDEGVSSWWRELVATYSLLTSREVRRREGRVFASFAESIRRGLGLFVVGTNTAVRGGASVGAEGARERYSVLLEILLEKYGGRDGAVRHIGLLFAMLPPSYQPVDALRLRFENTVDVDAQAALLPGSITIQRNSLPPNFTEDASSLLPKRYSCAYNTSMKSFQISPALQLYEIGINEEAGTTAISTIFGPLSSKPLTRTRPNLGRHYYTLLGISGGVGCALTHALVIPLDVVKTRMQTNPGEYEGVFDGAITIAREEGVSALLLGTQATLVGYLWYGISVYPAYAFFKMIIADHLLSPAFAVAHANDVALVAGAVASIVASLGLTPIEAARIRAVAEPQVYRDKGLLGTLAVIGREDEALGWRNLYAGLPSLMTSIASCARSNPSLQPLKFLAFERASEAIFVAWPGLRDATYTALGVSLVAGGFAGALSSVVSQPADSVLTYVTKQNAGGNLGAFDGAKMMVQQDGVGSLFRGLGSRCVWAGCIIAGQFLLYDVFRGLFGITGDDLNQVFELVLLPR
ncbi:hypothetical protein ACHAW6_015417 [Cyclotella cf. meneghiniana]